MSVALKLTLAEYNRMIERGGFDTLNRRVELIRGELREMNPAGPLHNQIIRLLTHWSVENVSIAKVLVSVQCSIELPELGSVLEPDVAWIRNGDYHARQPQPEDVLLIIEVAHSSLGHDLEEKLQLYATAAIAEYWVVDVNGESVRVFREPSGNSYRYTQTVRRGQAISPLVAPTVSLEVNALFDA